MGCGGSKPAEAESTVVATTKSADAIVVEPPVDEQPTANLGRHDLFKNLSTDYKFRCKALKLCQRWEDNMTRVHKTFPMTPSPFDTCCLLPGISMHKRWRIYLRFDTWPAPVSAQIVDKLRAQYKECLDKWTVKLKGYNGFTSAPLQVKIYGFVFGPKVVTEETFAAKYGAYPTVRNWSPDEKSTAYTSYPWKIECDGKEVPFPHNLEKKQHDLCTVRVTGKLSRPSRKGAVYENELWDQPATAHPEGIDGADTIFWLGHDRWAAVGQRHYLSCKGVVKNHITGDMGTWLAVMLHEMGHCFFLDDMYEDAVFPFSTDLKFPAEFDGPCGCDQNRCKFKVSESLMGNSPDGTLKVLDHVLIRYCWNASKKVYKTRAAYMAQPENATKSDAHFREAMKAGLKQERDRVDATAANAVPAQE